MTASTAVKTEELKIKLAMVKHDSDDPPSPFPKALHVKSQSTYEEATRREWVHDRYQPESPRKIDSYRPKAETDSYRPQPLGENRPPTRPVSSSTRQSIASVKVGGKTKESGPLRTLPNGSTGAVEQRAALDPSLIANDCSKPCRSLRKLIQQKASSAGVSMEKIEACFEEKVAIAEKFADRSRDWQMFFVEASVWGRFFTGPFPGAEPSTNSAEAPINLAEPKATSGAAIGVLRLQDKLQSESTSSSKPSSLKEYSASISEKLMEGKAIRQDKRRDFFQYLQKMRTYSRSEHKGKACAHIRGWFADNLTWQKFFSREPYPFAQPPGKLNVNCTACLTLPNFAPLKSGTTEKVLKSVYDSGHDSQTQRVRKPSPVVGALSARSAIRNAGSPITKLQAGQVLRSIEASQDTKDAPTQPIAKSDVAPAQSRPVLPTAGPVAETQAVTLHTPVAPPSRRSLRTPPPCPPARPASNQGDRFDSHPQSPPPLHLITQLAHMWARDPFMGKGTVVMQNTVPVICNKKFVGELFTCFASDRKQAIAAISAELNCYIHYYATSTGDMFLWTEPKIPRDVSSFNRGHMFITGWVARVISFGMAKPSVHWSAIRAPLAPTQARPAPVPLENAADALNRLASYVKSAADKAIRSATDDASVEGDQSSEVAPMVIEAQITPPLTTTSRAIPFVSDHTTSTKTKIYPSSFENPEKQWQRYKIAFRTSDIDRLMVEETAKNEGDLRMVLDKESGQIISVGELLKRTFYRCSLRWGTGEVVDGSVSGSDQDAVDASMIGKKRKGVYDDDEENIHEDKRACV
ncbi:hypothetical protein BKA65DRAFT_94380 [Rhexocercosporidium sp. MPI-PUGE-AT-0058]|nr:hypothetical protein BKA65DRAFT_94380 [Rhexocercosporidium sp. MPI-PUGE-AT-0058]